MAAVTAGLLAHAAGPSPFSLTRRTPRPPTCHATLDSVPIYLTFDDGIETRLARGESGPTLDVLDILDARGVPATFFLHGSNTGLAEGGVLARMLRHGHRIGNHLYEQTGMTLGDAPPPGSMARSFLDTELGIRAALEPYPDAYERYTAGDTPRLFRRPGGGYDHAAGNYFLLPDGGFWVDFQYDRRLAYHRQRLGWLRGVYDYSGWHISVLPLWMEGTNPESVVNWIMHGETGVDWYRAPLPDDPAITTQDALDGLILLLHDPDPRVAALLPTLLDALDERGATYHTLPRPVDSPNAFTVGISRPCQIARLDA